MQRNACINYNCCAAINNKSIYKFHLIKPVKPDHLNAILQRMKNKKKLLQNITTRWNMKIFIRCSLSTEWVNVWIINWTNECDFIAISKLYKYKGHFYFYFYFSLFFYSKNLQNFLHSIITFTWIKRQFFFITWYSQQLLGIWNFLTLNFHFYFTN